MNKIKIYNRSFTILLCMVVLTILLSACGQNGDTEVFASSADNKNEEQVNVSESINLTEPTSSTETKEVTTEILQNRRDVIKYLNDCGTFFIITSSEEKPNVKRFSFIMEYEDKMLFVTSNQKDIFADFMRNPNIIIIATPDNDDWLKISGKVNVCTTKELKKAALEFMPELKELYSIEDEIFEVFTLDEAIAEYSTKKSSIAASVEQKRLN